MLAGIHLARRSAAAQDGAKFESMEKRREPASVSHA